MIISLFIILVASFFLGTFGLGFKKNEPLSWEAFWLTHAFTGMLLLPIIWAYAVTPELFKAIASTSSSVLYMSMIYGFLWGIGGLLFGISIKKVGVSLTYGVVMGITGSLGAIIPFFQIQQPVSEEKILSIGFGVFFMVIGISLIAIAGIKREKIIKLKYQGTILKDTNKPNVIGIILVLISGVFSSFINIGFAAATPVAQNAESYGASKLNSGLSAWVVVLLGAFIFNFGYSLILLVKNRSWNTFKNQKSIRGIKWAVISASLWFGSLAIYGIGAFRMGNLGPVLAWPAFVGLSLIFSNVVAIKSGEWKYAEKCYSLLFSGISIIIIATIWLALS